MTILEFTNRVSKGENLPYEEMIEAVKIVFNEETPKDEIADFLIALSTKGETVQEIAALATVMKANALPVPVPEGSYLDNCGTGGDGLKSFNISTTSAFVLAASGVPIAKHGNRKISSASGSADVLQALGIHTDFTIEDHVEMLKQEGITFLFAPHVHPKLKRIGEVRRAIGAPTIFNMVGPLTNPVNLQTQLVGINRPEFVTQYAEVLNILGRKRAVVVSGTKGMDEASLDNENKFALLENGEVKQIEIRIEDLGLSSVPVNQLRGGTPDENADILRDLLKGKQSPYFDAVLLNAALGLFASNKVDSVLDGVELALETIQSGHAIEKLEAVIEFSQGILKERAI
ncbi:anthranilate phosphoribosyltransferase [Ureibacillus massiliensis 4400831 = CIP 108448 = CCUG 49529]|uniref:Anthranilate phosphoribosyltransferase n=1 Tax=Ureibacillus massiliensis 4400831 = CIP 108448 = CCUG 49529 TaxID=1211035 RepID=A0A0A3J9F5_9BACL|nr:anthranilate phosphoribosyltransferase [Ureibacillus massiliensis]KGR92410.1 anthranilate phosphoribosyltransferase [Ureibacillus massiliensis 4400831 = CIP 108448 = CCUG 49529]